MKVKNYNRSTRDSYGHTITVRLAISIGLYLFITGMIHVYITSFLSVQCLYHQPLNLLTTVHSLSCVEYLLAKYLKLLSD